MGWVSSCSETEEAEETEYLNWTERNKTSFLQTLEEAKSAIAAAKRTYGDDWTAHCDWRVFRTYALGESSPASATDSIAVKILRHGKGEASPYFTDSVRVNYLARYIPNELSLDEESRTRGEIFAYTGVSKDSADVFNPAYSSPVMLLVSNNIEGFTTAVMRMHVDDLWRIYIPTELGYGENSNYVRANSTLIYDLELKAFYRRGSDPGIWQ